VSGATKTLHVFSSDTILSVKRKTQDGADRHCLIYDGAPSTRELVENTRTLSDYGVVRESTLTLMPPVTPRQREGGAFHIFVKGPTGEIFALQVYSHYTIHDLKHLIQHKEGTVPSEQRLIYAGEEMEDGRTLATYGIARDSAHQVLFTR
ncbi:ubiquitin-related domain-containing protein, partial [Baffinella frigidus]